MDLLSNVELFSMTVMYELCLQILYHFLQKFDEQIRPSSPPYPTASSGDLPYPEVPCGGGFEGRYPDQVDGGRNEDEVGASYVEGNEAWGKKSLMNKLPSGLDKMLDKGRVCLGVT